MVEDVIKSADALLDNYTSTRDIAMSYRLG